MKTFLGLTKHSWYFIVCAILGFVAGVFYLPVWLISWLLHIVSRLLLAISYFGMCQFNKGKQVFKSLFKWRIYGD